MRVLFTLAMLAKHLFLEHISFLLDETFISLKPLDYVYKLGGLASFYRLKHKKPRTGTLWQPILNGNLCVLESFVLVFKCKAVFCICTCI